MLSKNLREEQNRKHYLLINKIMQAQAKHRYQILKAQGTQAKVDKSLYKVRLLVTDSTTKKARNSPKWETYFQQNQIIRKLNNKQFNQIQFISSNIQ